VHAVRDVRRLVVALSRARLGLYVFGKKELFSSCIELGPSFAVLNSKPSRLQLVLNEKYPTSRKAEVRVRVGAGRVAACEGGGGAWSAGCCNCGLGAQTRQASSSSKTLRETLRACAPPQHGHARLRKSTISSVVAAVSPLTAHSNPPPPCIASRLCRIRPPLCTLSCPQTAVEGAFEVHNVQHMQAIVMQQLGISTQAQEAAKSRILAAHDNYTKVLLDAGMPGAAPARHSALASQS